MSIIPGTSQTEEEPEAQMEDDDYEVETPVDDPMMAMMPLSFGKQERKRDLAAGFAQTKRATTQGRPSSKPEVKVQTTVAEPDDDDSDDLIGPMPAEAENPEEDEREEDEFPISHEIVLKDHTKVPCFLVPANAGCLSPDS